MSSPRSAALPARSGCARPVARIIQEHVRDPLTDEILFGSLEAGGEVTIKVAPEGVEALKEVSGSVDRVLAQLIGGIQSGMGYLGAANLAQLRERARYTRVSPAGIREAGTHDIIEVKTGS